MRGEPIIAQPKPTPRVLERRTAKREEDAQVRAWNHEIDARDGKRCRCCGRRGNPEALTAIGKIHRAHIVDASRGGGMEPRNRCSLCSICHALEHAKQFFFVGTNANSCKLRFEIHEAAVFEVFGDRTLPPHVRMITDDRIARAGRM